MSTCPECRNLRERSWRLVVLGPDEGRKVLFTPGPDAD